MPVWERLPRVLLVARNFNLADAALVDAIHAHNFPLSCFRSFTPNANARRALFATFHAGQFTAGWQSGPPEVARFWLRCQNRGHDERKIGDARSRVICPGGVGFETSSASGGWGAVLVANSTRPGMTVPRSDETWLSEWSAGMGERSGARSRSRGVPGASQSAGQLKGKFSLPGSLAWWRVDLTRRASTQAESRPGRRGMETAKFGHDS